MNVVAEMVLEESTHTCSTFCSSKSVMKYNKLFLVCRYEEESLLALKASFENPIVFLGKKNS